MSQGLRGPTIARVRIERSVRIDKLHTSFIIPIQCPNVAPVGRRRLVVVSEIIRIGASGGYQGRNEVMTEIVAQTGLAKTAKRIEEHFLLEDINAHADERHRRPGGERSRMHRFL